MKRRFATERMLTGTPHVHHGYVYEDNKVVKACTHKHRRGATAQRCADRMLRRLEKERKP